MVITAIKQQERLKSRYSIYVDEAYAFSLGTDALLEQGLHAGLEINAEELKQFKKLSQDDKALGLTLAYAARRLRSEYEFTQYFKRKQYDPELIEWLFDKLHAYHYIDDERFARAWVETRRLLKAVSKRRLSQELRQKRVADSIVDRVLAEDTADEQTILRELVSKKRRQSRYQDDQKLLQYLARQGFSYTDSKNALEAEEY